MTQLYLLLDWPRIERAWTRMRYAERPNQLAPHPVVIQPRLFIRCGRHGVVVPRRHRLGFQVCRRCHP